MDDCVTGGSRPLVILVVAADQVGAIDRQREALARWQPYCACLIAVEGDYVPPETVPLGVTVRALRLAVLSGQLADSPLCAGLDPDRVTLVGDLAHLSAEILSKSPVTIVGCGATRLEGPPESGCALITSVFRSDPFLRGFLRNSTSLDGYDALLDHVFLVSRLSPLERDLLADHMADHANAVVVWNRQDPGLYACWNLGIQMARRRYISNANVDDLRDPGHVVALLSTLECNPDCAVAASVLSPFEVYPTDGTLPEPETLWFDDLAGPFSFLDLARLTEGPPPALTSNNLPHCMPVWRRSLHDSFGWFDEERFGTYADWAYWLKVLESGLQGQMLASTRGYYFVNPESHNRRGSDLERHHRAVENDFIANFMAFADRRPRTGRGDPMPEWPRKLALRGRTVSFGEHRNSFNALIEALEPLECADGAGVAFIPFVERQFVWGDSPGEAASSDPQPLTQPWIGILHVPFEAPEWFMPEISPETFFQTDLWKRSRPYCAGLITLSRDLEADLRAYDPDLRTVSLYHPTGFDAAIFDPVAYRRDPKIVQAGDWLRKLQAIHRLRAPGHRRIMLLKRQTRKCLERDISQFGDHRDPAVEMRAMVSNQSYDALLGSSVVLCLLYGTAANNVVIECIARATPILINPLPAVVEYLGRGYPLYVEDEQEAEIVLATPGAVEAAHAYLMRRRSEIDLSYGGFCQRLAGSGFYRALPFVSRPAGPSRLGDEG